MTTRLEHGILASWDAGHKYGNGFAKAYLCLASREVVRSVTMFGVLMICLWLIILSM